MNIGLAFQIVDDILDVTQTSEQLGKTAGKDTATEKATYPALFGIDASIKKAGRADGEGLSGAGHLWRKRRDHARDCEVSGGAEEVTACATKPIITR